MNWKVWWALSICDIIACYATFILCDHFSLHISLDWKQIASIKHKKLQTSCTCVPSEWLKCCNQQFSHAEDFQDNLEIRNFSLEMFEYVTRNGIRLIRILKCARMQWALRAPVNNNNNNDNFIHWWCEQTVSISI